jgi:antirestriction protein
MSELKESIDAILYQCDRGNVSVPWLVAALRGLQHTATHAGAAAEPSDAEFEAWLRTVCLQRPAPEAYDLARDAYRHAAALTSAPAEPWPKTATPEMIEAFKLHYKEGSIWTDRLTRAIEAMLEVAPRAPAQTPQAAEPLPAGHIWVECPNGHGTTHQHFDYCGCCATCGAVMRQCTQAAGAIDAREQEATWTTDMQQWASHWFGPDADEAWIAQALANLPRSFVATQKEKP